MQDSIVVGGEELASLIPLMQFSQGKTGGGSQRVLLEARGGRRYWSVAHDTEGFTVAGDSDSREYWCSLSTAILDTAVRLTPRDADLEISFDGDTATLEAGAFSASADECWEEHPMRGIGPEKFTAGSTAKFLVDDLRHLIAARATTIAPDKERDGEQVVYAGLADGTLSLRDPDSADVVSLVSEYDNSEGSIYVRFDLRRLILATAFLESREVATVTFPLYSGEAIWIATEGAYAYAVPYEASHVRMRSHVCEIVEETYGHLSAQENDEGELILRRFGNRISASFRESNGDFVLRVSGRILGGVAPSQELLAEINEHNLKTEFVKFVLDGDEVLVHVDLLAGTLDRAELVTAVDAVSAAQSNYGAVFSIVFGGELGLPPEEVRWQNYLSTIVRCEVIPGQMIDINGADALEDWPFPGIVHVLSGYNPQGVDLDGSGVNPQIAREVLMMGGRCVMAVGASAAGDYEEPSVAAWGLTREQATELGRRAGQDAIFEISEDEIRLVACHGDRVESRPRIG